MRVILASKSKERLRVLRNSGLDPEVILSGFREGTIRDPNGSSLCSRLAEAKGRAVTDRLPDDGVVVIAADTIMEFEGRVHGKPRDEAAAITLWRRMRGHAAIVRTGHFVLIRSDGEERSMVRVQSTTVNFADISDAEIEAYAATGEPIDAAGGFSLNRRGGAFVTSIDGDPFNVIGISMPMIRQMVIDLGVEWHTLWVPPIRAKRASKGPTGP